MKPESSNGASRRATSPDFAFEDEDSGANAEGLTNTVFGLDLTYGLDSNDGLSGWTFGAAALANTGDIAAEFDSAAGLLRRSETTSDSATTCGQSAASISAIVLAFCTARSNTRTRTAPTANEVTGYVTKNFSEFARMRFGVSHLDDEEGPDSTRFMIQLTSFFGPHAHGVNW